MLQSAPIRTWHWTTVTPAMHLSSPGWCLFMTSQTVRCTSLTSCVQIMNFHELRLVRLLAFCFPGAVLVSCRWHLWTNTLDSTILLLRWHCEQCSLSCYMIPIYGQREFCWGSITNVMHLRLTKFNCRGLKGSITDVMWLEGGQWCGGLARGIQISVEPAPISNNNMYIRDITTGSKVSWLQTPTRHGIPVTKTTTGEHEIIFL